MATQFDPIAKDESLNTTESPSRNVADVLAQGLDAIEQAIAGGSGSGGHTIVNASGTDMTQREKMQFVDAGVSDDSVNDTTEIEVIQLINSESDLTTADDGVYQGTWDESVSDVLTADMVGMDDGTGDTVADRLNRGSVSVTTDGVKTWSQLLDELWTKIDFSKMSVHTVYDIKVAGIDQVHQCRKYGGGEVIYFTAYPHSSPAGAYVVEYYIKQTGSMAHTGYGSSYVDLSNIAPSGSQQLIIYY